MKLQGKDLKLEEEYLKDSLSLISNENEKPFMNLDRIVNGYDKYIKINNNDTVFFLEPVAVGMEKKAVKIIDGKAQTECSGNVTKENIASLADIGVDFISSGALTHSSPILDVSLKNLHAI